MKPFIPAVAATFAALLSACSALPPAPLAGRDPGDPSAPAAQDRYAPVTAGMADYRPVEPKPWLEQNRAVAPRPREAM